MKRPLAIILILAASLLLGFLGVRKISFNVDILDVLPAELPNVQALKIYKENFNQRRDLLLAVKNEDAAMLARAAEELAAGLVADGLARKVEWKSALFDDPAALAETLAYLWLNSPPETVRALNDKLAPAAIPGVLETALENLAGSEFTGAEAMLDQYDPYGFLAHPFLRTLMQNAPQGDEFSSPDGTMRLLFLVPPQDHASYKEDAAWIEKLNAYLADWTAKDPARAGFSFGITGESPYKAQVAAHMERDLAGSTALTGFVVALLFWLIQRRFGLLLCLLLCLSLIFAATLATSALVFDKLSIMSVGFAAILMGLAADYGVLASQYHATFGGDARSLRRRIGPSILWAAATTSSVFIVLNLSAFPGIAQLGNMVAIGIAMAAFVTLFVFVPLLATGKQPIIRRVDDGKPAPVFLRHGMSLTIVCTVAAAGTFLFKGLPRLDYHLTQMPEDKIPAMKALRDIQKNLPAWAEGNFPILVTGKDDTALREALGRATATIQRLKADGVLESATIPAALWPQADNQKAAAPLLAGLAARRDALVAAAGEAGFSEEGTGLTYAVCHAWASYAAAVEKGETAYPSSPAATAVLGRFIARDADSHVLVGSLRPANYAEVKARDFEDLAPVNQPGVLLAAWQTLQSSIKPLMTRDAGRVVLPTAVMMLVMLAIMFRKRRDFLLALGFLVFCGVLLCAAMAVMEQPWTFQNMAALPVLLGTGIDYCIHVLLALRRYDGDLHRLWIGTGKALVFCGVTTAVGFLTLTGATDPGLASFGRIAGTGIIIALLVALVLLPAWYNARRPHPPAQPEAKPL